MRTGVEAFYQLSPEAQVQALQRLAIEALARWPGRFTTVTPVKLRENAVFSAIRDDGRRFAVRIHRHGYHSHESLRSELVWMEALNAAGVSAPPVLRSLDGELLCEVACGAVPEPRQVDLLEWLPGEPIGSAEHGLFSSGPEAVMLAEQVGALAGRLHVQSSGWAGAARMARHAWDEAGLVGPEPLWGRFWNMPGLTDAQVQLLQRARARAGADLTSFGKGADRFGLIHADFVPENLLFDGARLSLIDFDDCGIGWHMFELATALFFTLEQDQYPDLKAALFRGYRQERPLPAAHEALLPLFLFLRSVTYLGWMQTRPETATAQEMAPLLVARACRCAEEYLRTDLADCLRAAS